MENVCAFVPEERIKNIPRRVLDLPKNNQNDKRKEKLC
jgi:hypothetical protein